MDIVSIITPSYNSEKYLKDCIVSVLNQTLTSWEMLIVDDASSDNSRKLIESYLKKDKRIKAFFLEKNIGPAMARNYAIHKASGRYIAFLDSDDMWLPHKLELQVDFMKLNNYSFVFSSYQVISENNSKVINEIVVPNKISYNQYLKNTIIGCLTVMIDKNSYSELQMPDLRSSHDMALWLDLLREGEFAFGIEQPLAKYRLVKSSNTNNKFNAIYGVWRVYRNYEGFSFFYSLYNFVFYLFNAIKKRY
ncbi:MAG: glycosyltransferase family 2 protein [Flavobacteriales bacterium]